MAITIAILGDSIAAGYGDHHPSGSWVQRLRHRLQLQNPEKIEPEFLFYNLSTLGLHTLQAVTRLGELIAQRQADAVIWACGINDLATAKNYDIPRLKSAEYLNIYQKLGQGLARFGIKFMVLPILPVEESKLPLMQSAQSAYSWKNSDIDQHNVFIAELCQRFGITQIPVQQLWPTPQVDFTWDGVHLRSWAQDILAENIFTYLQSARWFTTDAYAPRAIDPAGMESFCQDLYDLALYIVGQQKLAQKK